MLKIALVHDMLVQEGGQERVLRALQELFPQAPTFVLIYNKNNKMRYYKDKDIRTTFLQKLPKIEQKFQWYLPLMSTAIESHDLSKFDIVLSSASSFAKGILCKPETKHICYCHTPTRYLWSDAKGYVEDLPYPDLIKNILPFYLSHLRHWDWSAAQRVDKFLANSQVVKTRIQKYYKQPADVIYPPVDVYKFYISSQIDNFYLVGGRLVPYKRYDLVIQAFNKLNEPLKIFGTGPELVRLKSMAKSNIEFLGRISEERKAKLFSKCKAFLNPQEEDFGITAIEAMASGRPVVAYKKGGAVETILSGITGEFFEDQTWEDLANTIIHFKPEKYDSQKIRQYALKFSKERFQKEIKQFIKLVMNNE